MKVCSSKEELSRLLDLQGKSGLCLGLVPTMGALHEGHLSLLKKAREECDYTVVSIFVNPTQFNDPSDLEKYPRTPEADLALLKDQGADLVFMPGVNEMYPEKDTRIFDLGGLDAVMEGKHRPGHFNGVAQIVSKLFEAVGPDKAYFGQKDFQQLTIIRHMVKDLELGIEIVACPIVREKDGLAMSSRNTRLSEEARTQAPFIYQMLMAAREKCAHMNPDQLRSFIEASFARRSEFKLEYFDIVDDHRLQSVTNWEDEGGKIACIAAYLEGVRLIDNMIFA